MDTQSVHPRHRRAVSSSLPTSSPRHGFRSDIQGLRALCIIAIAIFHAWGVGTPVGVDVFVMISAFLLTGSFLRSVEGGKTPHIIERWFHYFKRLLPPLVVTVLATLLLSYLYLPNTRWRETITQAITSLSFTQNWYLNAESVDYYADQGVTSSPLMHLWYVAMQGQVYLVLPLILVIVAWIVRGRRKRYRMGVIITLTVIAVGFFAWMMWALPAKGASGVYFDTRARAWEFALGGVAAAFTPRLPAWCSRIATWLGMIALLAFIPLTLTNYPGPLALIAVVASAFVLWWGGEDHVFNAGKVLSWKPLVWIGDNSYAFYLTHWPLIACYKAARGSEHLGFFEGAFLLLIGLGLASLLTIAVDSPLHHAAWTNRAWWTKATVVVASLAIGLLPAIGANTYLDRQEKRIAAEESDPYLHPGAGALAPGWKDHPFSVPAIPAATSLDNDWGKFKNDCTGRYANPPLGKTDVSGGYCQQLPWKKNAKLTTIAVGDSHVEQYLGLLEPVAQKNNWNMAIAALGGCQLTTREGSAQLPPGCADHNANILPWLIHDLHPDVVFIVSTRTQLEGPDTPMSDLATAVKQLSDAGIRVVGLRDNPRFSESMYECPLKEGVTQGNKVGCLRPRSQVYQDVMPDQELRAITNYRGVDVADWICPDGTCPAIIGNIFVYHDDNHLTVPFTRSLYRVLGDEVRKAAVEK